MIFCKKCGGALNLFETYDEDICYACLRKEIKQEQPIPIITTGTELLVDAIFSHEGGKIVLRSPEGWVLWSAPDSETHSLGTILNRARRIHEIRCKRQKN